MSGRAAYRAGIVVAAVTSVVTVWITIVHDDGNGLGFFAVIIAALVGGFAAWFSAAGLMRTMLGTALMQILVGIAIATAPSTHKVPDAAAMVLVTSCTLAALWGIAAICFGIAARKTVGRDA